VVWGFGSKEKRKDPLRSVALCSGMEVSSNPERRAS
jgi:hypothetical protein